MVHSFMKSRLLGGKEKIYRCVYDFVCVYVCVSVCVSNLLMLWIFGSKVLLMIESKR